MYEGKSSLKISRACQTAHTWVVKMGKVYEILDIGGLSTFDGGGKIWPGVVTGRGRRISMSSRPCWSSSKFQATRGYIRILSQKKTKSDTVRNKKPAKDTKDFGAEKPFWTKITGILRKLG